jgi:mRNA-degrading endonuclease RelE of RelBE toxin-antitoxin system
MPYTVVLRPSARKRYLAMERPVRARIGAAIDALASDPHPTGVIKVKNADQWRIRVGTTGSRSRSTTRPGR